MKPYGWKYQHVATIEKRSLRPPTCHEGDRTVLRLVLTPDPAGLMRQRLVVDVHCPHWHKPTWWLACVKRIPLFVWLLIGWLVVLGAFVLSAAVGF